MHPVQGNSQMCVHIYSLPVPCLPRNLTDEQRKALGRVAGVRLRRGFDGDDIWYLTLPKHIGNAALAFDERVAFQSYAKGA